MKESVATSNYPIKPSQQGLPIEELFNRYNDKLFHYFLKLTKENRFDARDLVQTVFLKLLINGKSFNGSGNFEAWLFTIARNCGRDYFRKKNVQDWLEEKPQNYLLDLDILQLDQQEQTDLLYDALSILKPGYREIIILFTFQGLSLKKIAGMLGISETNARLSF